jgi:hypothetical protein
LTRRPRADIVDNAIDDVPTIVDDEIVAAAPPEVEDDGAR